MPDSAFDLHVAPASALLFGDQNTPPLWLWLTLEPDEIDRLETALLDHLRSPLFPPRIGERPIRPGDDSGLLDFAAGFAPIAGRFAGGYDLLSAATRIVAERGGMLCRTGALACIEALQHRQHAEARALGDSAGGPTRLRRFVLTARLAADLWLRFVPGMENGRAIGERLGDAIGAGLRAESRPPSPSPAPEPEPPATLATPAIRVLGNFEPPHERGDWASYRALGAGVPLHPVPRDAFRRLAALAETAPGFAAPLAELRRGLALAAHAGRPSPRLRPLLLVGAPGVGKTWFARRVASELALPFAALNLGGATDNRCLQGTARGWSAATPAWPVAEMARLGAPNPIFFLDEIDKAGGQRDSNGRVHDTLLAMIEPASAGSWFDECLRTTADLRHALWIMAANTTRDIPAPLLSRLSVHQIEAPPATAFDSVAEGLLSGIAEDMGCFADDLPTLAPATEAALRQGFARHRNLRRLRAQIEECLGLQAEAALAAAH